MLHRAKWLAGSALLIALGASAGCSRGDAPPADPRQNSTAAAPAAAPPPAPVVREDTLDREAIIIAALRAATAAALGTDDSKAQAAVRGRKFALRIRFGCPGFSSANRGWTYDEKAKVLRVNVRSDLTEAELPASDLLRRAYQGAVGFTLDRPWLLAPGCPVPESGFGAASSGGATLVIAQLFTDADSRVQRPERVYQLTKPVEPEERPGAGLDLVISGRLAELSDGRPIHCAARDGAPACLVAAKIDRVAIENPADGALLGEWGSGVASR
jgi:hypothetical protein